MKPGGERVGVSLEGEKVVSDGVTVDFGSLDAVAQNIKGRVKVVETRLNELDRQLGPLRTDWTGAASEAYEQTKATWSRDIGRMNDLLARIGQAVELSRAGFAQAEQDNVACWRG